jgi:hypothetical protein
MDHLVDRGMTDHPAHKALYKGFNNFSAESNTAATLSMLASAAGQFNAGWEATIRGIASVGIRHNNYPSYWDHPSQPQRDAFRLANPGTVVGFWKCPRAREARGSRSSPA